MQRLLQVTPIATLGTRLKKHRRGLALGLLLSLVQSALAYPIASVLRWCFDFAVPAKQTGLLVRAGLLLLFLRVISALMASAAHRINLKACLEVSNELRRELLTRTFNLPKLYFQRGEAATVYDTMTAEMSRVDTMLRALLGQVLPNCFLSASLALVLLSLDDAMFLILLGLWPATWLLNELFRRRVVQATLAYNSTYKRSNEFFRWLIGSLDFVRIRHAEALESRRGEQVFSAIQSSARPLSTLGVDYLQVQSVLLMALSLVVLLYGGTRVSQQAMTQGSLLSFFLIVNLLNGSLREVAAGLYHCVIGRESWKAVTRMLSCSERLPYAGTVCKEVLGCLEMRGVQFGYEQGQPILKDFDLVLRAGSVTALTGPNGSGKTTVLALLLGFIKPTEGVLEADGLAYDQWDIGCLRQQIGVVTQDPVLFSGTIWENLTYAHAETPEEDRVWKSLRKADAEQWILSLPQGLHTTIGDAGCRLSGGQRQKLAIARALLGEPRFLLLDEPTNHLDLRAVGRILAGLKELQPGPGILLVTHDEGVVQQASERVLLAP